METLENLTENNTPVQQTLFAGDSPASLSAKPEKDKGGQMTAFSFPKCFELFQRSNRVGLSLKMFAESLVSNLETYSRKLPHRWTASVTKHKRFVFLLVPSTRPTDEIGFGLLPTPTTNDTSGGASKVKLVNGRFERDAGTINHSANLQSVIQALPELLPTPQTRDYHAQGANHNPKAKSSSLATILEKKMDFLPTPKARDWKGEGFSGQDLPNTIQGEARNGTKTGLKLQPAFVEWMQGFPIGWTDLEA